MHLDLTPEALLAQLGYTRNEQSIQQMKNIMDNTKDFSKFSQHLLSFNDALAVEKGFIAMSNSEDHLKIKCEADSNASNLSAYTDLVQHWADKYKLDLQKVDGKNTYYIIGHI